jgi:ABC-type spermidine/putrescine transport system permease subunit II
MRSTPLLLGLYARSPTPSSTAPVWCWSSSPSRRAACPIPPFDGPSLRWYGEVLADRRLMAGLTNSLLVALGVGGDGDVTLGFLAAYGLARDGSCRGIVRCSGRC